jgi:hypothetical protein
MIMIRQWGYTALGRVYLAFSEHLYDTCVRHTLQPVQYNSQTVTVNALMSEPGVRDPQAHREYARAPSSSYVMFFVGFT